MENGPDDAVDIFHTYFGVAAKENLMIQNCVQGWSILESNQIDPAYALPVDVINWILLTK
ncbi:hypothetical protein Bca4012_090987 [Brassica carinata]|uniref:Uncharacterized protein n=1 Tax=Brassica oleracea var. oleracea TaxID=109376 RepID=A0A0D3AEC6_BRAOL